MDIIYNSQNFLILMDDSKIYISVLSPNASVYNFNDILKCYPQVKVTYFSALQKALSDQTKEPVLIGSIKERYELDISSDEMKVFIKINIPNDEIESNKKIVISEIIDILKRNEISVGIKSEIFKNQLTSDKKILIAEGILPIPGEDSKLTYYKISSRKPRIDDSGETDFYELDLISNVKMGDWLGEKTLPRQGVDGMTVKGNIIPAKLGRDYRLKYDSKTVEEICEGEKYVLRAKNNGAVNFIGEKICVDNHLTITGNVDFETGNIYFDGSVTITGTVQDKFVVEATGDIEIKGYDGVGSIGRIQSTNGSIFIKGGVNGKGEGKIIAENSIYVKYVNEGHLEANNEISVSLYAYDSYLKASKIYINPRKGKIVGGEIHAKHKIVSGTIGNFQERPTIVNVEGFERIEIKEELDNLLLKSSSIISEASRMKRKLEIFEQNYERLDDRAKHTYTDFLLNYEDLLDEIRYIKGKADQLEDILKTRGEGEIKIFQSVYPKTMMEFKSLQKKINEAMKCSFYIKDYEIHLAE